MSVVIRMKREGRKNRPSYRISVANPRNPRDGATLEKLGHYDPLASTPEKQLQFDVERARYWLGVGAQPSETVASIFRRAKLMETPATPKKDGRKHDRTGRKAKTKTSARRQAAQKLRAERKAARPPHRRKPKKAPEKKAG
jgi:small subunit ribosomal protein S16